MASVLPSSCPRCGAPAGTELLCRHCGLDMTPWLAREPEQSSVVQAPPSLSYAAQEGNPQDAQLPEVGSVRPKLPDRQGGWVPRGQSLLQRYGPISLDPSISGESVQWQGPISPPSPASDSGYPNLQAGQAGPQSQFSQDSLADQSTWPVTPAMPNRQPQVPQFGPQGPISLDQQPLMQAASIEPIGEPAQLAGPPSFPGGPISLGQQYPASHNQAPSPAFLAPQTPQLPPSPTPSALSAPQAKKRRMARPLIGLILVSVMIVVGTAGYFCAPLVGLRVPDLLHIVPTQTPIRTVAINALVTYAGVDVTVLKVQQSQNFVDDPNTSQTGMVRIFLQGLNKASIPVNVPYANVVQLVLPDGKKVAPTYTRANVIGILPGARQQGLVDFAVAGNINIRQLVLQIGASDEAQMGVPLSGQADALNEYKPKISQLNGKVQYQGLDWTLLKATSQMYLDGKQAQQGMHYVTLTLKLDNTLAQAAIVGSAYDYMRLQAGGVTALPQYASLPLALEEGASGKTGSITFMVPQNATDLTLLMLTRQKEGFKQATLDFHL
ncbi:hypothetical protein EPA93_43170 [Ktedonosporobacter rubrisoli]|uniref:DUF4352 domain-containing protein n=1 Tax=Ktedonosporobacter rubrisoli TaxID=2509675 RepID=A0A4P6K2I2_KTERU|nr:hypothetical protein [Ktedonosporobacter rubrisoli]QBD82418.1 hypothetical protein EPA93_43170 [Ktedonosporobacter rubrisoli]